MRSLGMVLLASSVFASSAALADENNLSNGAFITHYVSQIQYSSDVPAEGSWAAHYSANYAVTDCAGQVTDIPGAEDGNKIWFLLAAWTEEKVFSGVEFGIVYNASRYLIYDHGPCFPANGLQLPSPSPAWPNPGSGIAIVAIDQNWEGNFVPVYYFWGYTYGSGTVAISTDPNADPDFCGTGNSSNVEYPVGAGYRGAIGLNGTAGAEVCPLDLGPGACCIDGGNQCMLVPQDFCLSLGGHFHGAGTSCDPNPCPTTWACCVSECCFMLSEDDCVSLFGGFWLEGQICSEAYCGTAACCLEGTCQLLTSFECEGAGGSWHPEWPSCQPNPCHQILRVDPDGTGDYPTIQAAIDAAFAGDTILLSDGTFRGAGNRDLRFRGKPLTVMSESGNPASCIIDCQGSAIAPHRGFLFLSGETSAATIAGLSIIHGHAQGQAGDNYGGAILCRGASVTVRDCILRDNAAGYGAAIACDARSAPLIQGCTIYANRSLTELGASVDCRSSSTPSLDHCLVCGTVAGRAVGCDPTSQPQLHCCDLFDNAGGDYLGCVAGFLGASGNISADPQFCNPEAGHLSLACHSPCLTASGCGRIGALGEGCSLFGLAEIGDVPNDQGRQIRLTWRSVCDDAPGADTTIVSYSVWRRVDPLSHARADRNPAGKSAEPALRYPPGQWDFVCSVPAGGEAAYSAVCPTLCDSTVAEGPCWSTFFVRAHTPSPTIHLDCAPDSGYSIDNLAPEPPPNLRLAGPSLLQWEEVAAADFDYFSIYGSSSEGMDAAVRLGYTSSTSFSIAGQAFGYYHVAATDFSGNQGAFATIHGSGAVVLPGDPPRLFALRECRPNPFVATTAIAFDLPSDARTVVRVYDPAGRLVRTLLERELPTASYLIHWAGDDDSGRPLPRSVYFVHLRAGGDQATARVVLLR